MGSTSRPPPTRLLSQPSLMPQRSSQSQPHLEPGGVPLGSNHPHYGLRLSDPQKFVRSQTTSPFMLEQTALLPHRAPHRASSVLQQPSDPQCLLHTTVTMPAAGVAAAAAALTSFMSDGVPQPPQQQHPAASLTTMLPMGSGTLTPLMQAMQVASAAGGAGGRPF